MSDATDDGWADVEDAAADMFNTWYMGSEREWAREAWGHLHAANLVGGETPLESTLASLRLAALAKIYQEFCGFAWGEDKKTPIECLVEGLDVDPLALGIIAGSIDAKQFSGTSSESELCELALIEVMERERATVFRCLKAAYGGHIKLFERIARTVSPERESDDDEDVFWSSFFSSDAAAAALKYVSNGFIEG